MLTHPTLKKPQRLKFTGMLTALAEQMKVQDIEDLAFEEPLGLLVNRELTERENRHLSSRLGRARLKHNAAVRRLRLSPPQGPG